LLLSSTRVMPSRLIESGYHFRFPYLELALRNTLGKDTELRHSSGGQFLDST
jgi:NAD dependent epimerase/dehydratase family enzyme